MNIKVKRRNHFLNLLEDSQFAQRYFLGKDVDKFSNDSLNELQNMLRKAKRRYDRMTFILSIMHFFKLENRTNIASKVEKSHRELNDIVYELVIFESDLAYLIISEKITIDDCCEKNNLDSAYLMNLLEKYKKQVARPYLEYDYDENTDQVSEITDDGESIILSSIPRDVSDRIKEIKKLKQQLNSDSVKLLNELDILTQSFSGRGFVKKKRMIR